MPSFTRQCSGTALLILLLLGVAGCGAPWQDSPRGTTHADTVAFFQKRALRGDTSAVVWMAKNDEQDDGMVADTARTLSQLRDAARAGSLEAMLLLGDSYNGRFERYSRGSIDLAAASVWYRSAANLGYAPALQRVGWMFIRQRDIPAHADSTIYYLSLAGDKGDPQAWYWLGLALFVPTLDSAFAQYSSASRSASYLEKAADAGEAEAAYMLGSAYLEGWLELDRDPAVAVRYLKLAAELGSPDAFSELGECAQRGVGMARDLTAAGDYFQEGAIRGSAGAQNQLSLAHTAGAGVSLDHMRAYAWYLVASLKDTTFRSESRRTFLQAALSGQQCAEAEHAASVWRRGGDLILPKPEAAPEPEGEVGRGSGTAFAVTHDGLALTNYHVIENAKEIRVAGHEGLVVVVAADRANDLALVRLPFRPQHVARFGQNSAAVALGEDVVVFGFPLERYLSSGGNVTTGTLSAVAGLGNNTSRIQITAAIQPGSSGSPVMSRTGDVIGIVNSTMKDSVLMEETGNTGQNINFAINLPTMGAFLDASHVRYARAWPWPHPNRSTRDIARDASRWTFRLQTTY